MINDLNEKNSHRIILAAIISAFVFAIAGLLSGLIPGIINREKHRQETKIARYLLIDAADGLNHTLSAMRLCNENDTAWELGKTALVYAVRAETALECDNTNGDNRAKEAFLNDVATVLHTNKPLDAVKLSEKMYEFSAMFKEHLTSGAEFVYNGELTENGGNNGGTDNGAGGEEDADKEEIAAAEKLLQTALGTERSEFIGAFDGKLEFNVERDGKPGYAVTEGTRIVEFSFAHSGSGEGENMDEKAAGEVALECAEKCGFTGLEIFNSDIRYDFGIIKLCKNIDGAMACDECASVAVVGRGEEIRAVAFTAGKCETMHKVPQAKFTEEQARKSAPGAKYPGVLVTRTVNGKDRVCYRYRYDLGDGVHFVYVCAENGRQMQVN